MNHVVAQGMADVVNIKVQVIAPPAPLFPVRMFSLVVTRYVGRLFLGISDPQEGLGWYLLGRCYMAAQQHELAYGAYEQAV